jgi:hypothetical protein
MIFLHFRRFCIRSNFIIVLMGRGMDEVGVTVAGYVVPSHFIAHRNSLILLSVKARIG